MEDHRVQTSRCEYDPVADAAYIYLAEQLGPGEVARTVPVSSSGHRVANLDVDKGGRLLGLEVCTASRFLRPEMFR